MEMTSPSARPFFGRPVAPGLLAAGGLALLAVGFYAAVVVSQPIVAAMGGAAGLALLRLARAERPYLAALIVFDAAAFAIFAFQRNNSLGFWLLPGPWADVWRFNAAGATIALMVYAGGAIMALIAGYRGLRLVEAMSLIAVPFLFNLLPDDRRRLAHGRARRSSRPRTSICRFQPRSRSDERLPCGSSARRC